MAVKSYLAARNSGTSLIRNDWKSDENNRPYRKEENELDIEYDMIREVQINLTFLKYNVIDVFDF